MAILSCISRKKKKGAQVDPAPAARPNNGSLSRADSGPSQPRSIPLVEPDQDLGQTDPASDLGASAAASSQVSTSLREETSGTELPPFVPAKQRARNKKGCAASAAAAASPPKPAPRPLECVAPPLGMGLQLPTRKSSESQLPKPEEAPLMLPTPASSSRPGIQSGSRGVNERRFKQQTTAARSKQERVPAAAEEFNLEELLGLRLTTAASAQQSQETGAMLRQDPSSTRVSAERVQESAASAQQPGVRHVYKIIQSDMRAGLQV